MHKKSIRRIQKRENIFGYSLPFKEGSMKEVTYNLDLKT